MRYQGANTIRARRTLFRRLNRSIGGGRGGLRQILEQKGVVCGAHLVKVKDVVCHGLDPINVTKEELKELRTLPFPVREEPSASRSSTPFSPLG